MKLILCLLALAAVTAGCRDGEDVWVEPGEPGEAKSSLACELTAGEDVCARDWSSVELAEYVDHVVTFAGEARDSVEQLDVACLEMLAALQVSPPERQGNVTDSNHVRTTCARVATTIRTRRKSAITAEMRPAACTPVPARLCLPSRATHLRCDQPLVTLHASEGEDDAAEADRELTAALQPSFGRVFWMRERLRQTTESADRIVRMMPALTAAMPACMTPYLSILIGNGASDARATIEIFNELVSALGS